MFDTCRQVNGSSSNITMSKHFDETINITLTFKHEYRERMSEPMQLQ